ncbi:uncharacterized protein LOC116945113 isoform X1 [Petromyzon marinus]|uniref:uncharacterized protein LOC116945113 isoform X1 n=1 Tax=Petromyzon marinus TaxID=7757 RepID=UPI003F6F9A9D
MENRNRRVRLVVKLQAAARGFLLRARLRALRGDYERVVSEVQGGLAGLSWVEGLVARPQFCSGDADPAAPHAPGDAPERDATRLPRGYKGEHADPELGEGAQGTAPQAQGSPLLTQRGPEEAAGTRDPETSTSGGQHVGRAPLAGGAHFLGEFARTSIQLGHGATMVAASNCQPQELPDLAGSRGTAQVIRGSSCRSHPSHHHASSSTVELVVLDVVGGSAAKLQPW